MNNVLKAIKDFATSVVEEEALFMMINAFLIGMIAASTCSLLQKLM